MILINYITLMAIAVGMSHSVAVLKEAHIR